MAACLPVAVVGYFSAVAQGRAAVAGRDAGGAKARPKRQGHHHGGHGETYAILALLITILALTSLA